jgi:hypothetical protein
MATTPTDPPTRENPPAPIKDPVHGGVTEPTGPPEVDPIDREIPPRHDPVRKSDIERAPNPDESANSLAEPGEPVEHDDTSDRRDAGVE